MSIGVIDVRDLVGHPGASREETVRGAIDDLGSELARIDGDEPVQGRLLLESVVEGILVSGTLHGRWHLRCARCLTTFDGTFAVVVDERFVPDPEDDDDAYPFDPVRGIEPDQMIRDAVGVEMPFAPLCRPDCQGLCETCGGNRNLGECPGHAQVDPRFAVLSELTFTDPEGS
jgi:uncharacterized protein